MVINVSESKQLEKANDMQFKKNFLVFVFGTILSTTLFATAKSEHYIFNYSEGSRYEIELTENTITWTALDGPDKGQFQTNHLKRSMLQNHTEILQWSELDGTFVTVAFSRDHNEVVSSGKTFSESWLMSGTVEIAD